MIAAVIGFVAVCVTGVAATWFASRHHFRRRLDAIPKRKGHS